MDKRKMPYERPETFSVKMDTEVLQAVSQQADPLSGFRDNFEWMSW